MKVAAGLVLLLACVAVSGVLAHAGEMDISMEPSIPRKTMNKPAFTPKQHRNGRIDGTAIALEYAESVHPDQTYIVKNAYVTKHNGVTHVYLRQTVNDLEVANGDMNINVDRNGKVLSAGTSFFAGNTPKSAPYPRISALSALQSLASYLGVSADDGVKHIKSLNADGRHELFSGSKLSQDEINVKLMYIQTEQNTLELVWGAVIKRDIHWADMYASATTGSVVAVYDWEHGAQYTVYPIGVNDPSDGSRSLVVDPHLQSSGSPLGWHDQGNNRRYTTTIGNNVYAQENVNGGSSWENNYRPNSVNLSFNYPIDFTKEPEEYMDASITNLFFTSNICHDVFYQYGFDEVSGNFQENNFGNGGLGNDAVQANAQDGSGYNNANFATPVDGQRPRMRMYLWNQERPMLDGDLDNGYAHGLSNRLTGGPANSNCLINGEGGGMGEGWGDCLSLALRWRSSYTKSQVWEMGEWAAGEGIRLFPYAYDMTLNGQTYASINGAQYSGVHAKGCVWCTILYDVYLNLVEAYGFDENQYTGRGGNNRWFQIVIDGMKLQPCRPTFISARDAIIEADEVNYGGQDYCLLWRTFARRGLGTAASTGTIVRDSFAVPSGC